jgi:hypothetical protein
MNREDRMKRLEDRVKEWWSDVLTSDDRYAVIEAAYRAAKK